MSYIQGPDGEFYEVVPDQAGPQRSSGGGLAAAGIVAGLLVIILVVVMGGGGGGSPAKKPDKQAAPLPSVSISGARPCKVNLDPTIMLTADRLHTCVEAKKYAKAKLLGHYHQSAAQFACLDELWWEESKWSAWADNPSSSALGIPQGLKDPTTGKHSYPIGGWKAQVDWGLWYIIESTHDYKTPCKALGFWKAHHPHWY